MRRSVGGWICCLLLVCLETTGFYAESTFSAGFAGSGIDFAAVAARTAFAVVAVGAGFLVGAAVVE
jgi:hypothetical protein